VRKALVLGFDAIRQAPQIGFAVLHAPDQDAALRTGYLEEIRRPALGGWPASRFAPRTECRDDPRAAPMPRPVTGPDQLRIQLSARAERSWAKTLAALIPSSWRPVIL
jgi:hypothetical protein